MIKNPSTLPINSAWRWSLREFVTSVISSSGFVNTNFLGTTQCHVDILECFYGVARGDVVLVVKTVRYVSCSPHTWGRGTPCFWVHFDLPDGILLQFVADPFSVWKKPDFDKDSFDGKRPFLSGFCVFPFEPSDELAPKNLEKFGVRDDAHVRMCARCGDGHFVGAEGLRTIHKSHRFAVGEELERGFDSSVPAAHDRHILVGKKRAVARSTISEALLVVFFCARNIECAPARAACDEERSTFLL